jgi:hypothetical protein
LNPEKWKFDGGNPSPRWAKFTVGVSTKRRNKVLVLVPGLIVLGGLARLFFRGLSPGGEVVEVRGDATPASIGAAAADVGTNPQSPDAGSWPSYNRTLTLQRYSPLSQINTQTVRGLKVLCSYDTHVREVFTSAQKQPVAVSGMAQPTTRRTTSFSLVRPSGVPRSRPTEQTMGKIVILGLGRTAAMNARQRISLPALVQVAPSACAKKHWLRQ